MPTALAPHPGCQRTSLRSSATSAPESAALSPPESSTSSRRREPTRISVTTSITRRGEPGRAPRPPGVSPRRTPVQWILGAERFPVVATRPRPSTARSTRWYCRPMRRAVAAAGWVLLVAGCEQPRTELVARVESEVAWGAGRTVQSVTLTVRRGGPTGSLRSARTTALGVGGERRPLPLLVGIVPADDTDTPVWIEALGCRAPNGCTVATAAVAQRAVVRFAVGQTEEVPLLLASACVGVTCGSDERCGSTGRCEPATRATVRPFNGSDAGTVADVPMDVGRVDAARDVPSISDISADMAVSVDAPTIDLPAMDTAPPVDSPTPDTAASCGALELRCGGGCVAVLRDPTNCGACGEVCPAVAGATATCMGGRCGYACDAAHADCDERPSNGCESERATDHANCGTCGRSCTDRQECRAGVCVACGGELDWCAGLGCIDTATDRTNCGGCGRICMSGSVCQGSSCVADRCTPATMPPDAGVYSVWLRCPDGCVDIESNPRNCSWCGRVCPSGPCVAGSCPMPPCPAGMRLIPAGMFLMGSTTGSSNERPVHGVRLDSFCLDEAEVTKAEYRSCTASGCTTPGTGPYCNWPVSGRDDHPINCVDWNQARAYCQSRGGDLPTEAQWEYAASSGDGRTYPWGEDPPSSQLCWNRLPAPGSTCPVRSYPGSSGLFDMAGNLWEWTLDVFGMYVGDSGSYVSNPTGPASGPLRVYRGGSWAGAVGLTTRNREGFDPSRGDNVVGFRCARPPL